MKIIKLYCGDSPIKNTNKSCVLALMPYFWQKSWGQNGRAPKIKEFKDCVGKIIKLWFDNIILFHRKKEKLKKTEYCKQKLQKLLCNYVFTENNAATISLKANFVLKIKLYVFSYCNRKNKQCNNGSFFINNKQLTK